MNRDIVQYYIKRPVVIRAIQFNGANVELVREFIGKKLSAFHRKTNVLYINTPENFVTVNIGDYIVRGIVGKFTVVPEEAFNLTHEEFENGHAEAAAQL